MNLYKNRNEHLENVEKEISPLAKKMIDDVAHKPNEVPEDPKTISPKPYTPPLPFPQGMAKAKLD